MVTSTKENVEKFWTDFLQVTPLPNFHTNITCQAESYHASE